MVGGFRFLVSGLLAAVAVFALISWWPWLSGAVHPASSSGAPLAPGGGALAAVPSVVPPPLASPPKPPPSYTFAEERDRPPEQRVWLYTQQAAVLRVTPGGIGHRAPTISTAPLLILTGTRMWPVKTEGEWVLVRAPSGLLGWMTGQELGSRPPYETRDY